MLHRCVALLALTAVAGVVIAAAHAQEATKYPDWSGKWRVTGGNRWDPVRPAGRGQQPPLTPEYQAIFEASLADNALAGPAMT